MKAGKIVSKKILFISIALQIVALFLALTGISLIRSGQQGTTFLYAGLINQLIAFALVAYLATKNQQVKVNKKQ